MRPIFVNKFSIVTLLIVATATISLMACDANAQVLPEQPPTSGGSGETQAQPIETPPSSSEKTDEVNTGSNRENVEEFYAPDHVLIGYKEPAPALENEDETGTIYLRGPIPLPYEVTFISRGLAVVSEDFASVGVDTADLEILGGIQSSNTYLVGFNADIDPHQLSFQLRAIDRIDWAQPNFIYEIFTNSVIDEKFDRNNNE